MIEFLLAVIKKMIITAEAKHYTGSISFTLHFHKGGLSKKYEITRKEVKQTH